MKVFSCYGIQIEGADVTPQYRPIVILCLKFETFFLIWELYDLREEGYIVPADLKAFCVKLRGVYNYHKPNYSLTSLVPGPTGWSSDERPKI